MVELEIDIYFWMIDRGDFEDDQRNQVNVEKKIVKLHREHGQRLENGVYFGKLMHAIRKMIMKKSRKPFTIDPSLANLKDQATRACKQNNWNLIATELKKFGIKLTKEQRFQIVDEGKHGQLIDLLNKLKDYDTNLIAYSGVPEQGRKELLRNEKDHYIHAEENKEANSELNFGIGIDPIEKTNLKNADVDSHIGLRMNAGSDANQKSSSILMAAPMKKSTLSPLEGLRQNNKSLADLHKPETLPVSGRNNSKSFIQLHSMANAVNDFEDDTMLESMVVHEFEPSPSQFVPNGDNTELLESETTVMFIFASLKIALQMKQNQVGGLLANQHKFLVYMCIKGMKGRDFSKIQDWYKLINNNLGQLIFLLQNEQDQVKPTLDVLKCGLYSKNLEVCNLCTRVLTKLINTFHENDITDLKFRYLDWLTVQRTVKPSAQKPLASPAKLRSNSKSKKTAGATVDLDNFMSEPGLKAFLRAYRKHSFNYMDQFTTFLISAGKDSYIDLLTNHLRLCSTNNFEFLGLFQDLYDVMIQTKNGRAAVIDSGVINVLIEICYKIADNTNPASINVDPLRSTYTLQDASININERQRALVILVDFWRSKPEIIQNQANDGKITEAIMQVLKKGCRDKSKALSILSMNLMSSLLDVFSKERNKYAPIIYKAMTFILIELYLNQDLREEMLNIFIILFRNLPTIPIQILCEPLLKQIWIHLEKQDKIVNTILQPQSEFFTLNTTDFEFFMNIAIHPRLTANVASQILQIVLEVSRRNVIFTRISLKLLLTILSRFENNTQIFEFCQSQIRHVMKILVSQDSVKTEMYNHLSKDPKNQVMLRKKSLLSMASKDTQESTQWGNKHDAGRKSIDGLSSALKDKQKGIVASPSLIKNEMFIDDSDLQVILNPQLYQDESSQYMAIRTNEKMIVNQLQCFINTGIKVLVDYIRQQILETYIKIEKKLKFKNKGLLYLLHLYEKDVTTMLQYYNKEQVKIKQEKLKLRKEQEMQEIALMGTKHSFEDEQERTNYSKSPTPLKKRVSIVGSVKQLKSSVKPDGTPNIKDAVESYGNYASTSKKDMMRNSLNSRSQSISVGSKQDLAKLVEKRTLGEPVSVKALNIALTTKSGMSNFKLFDIMQCHESELEKYVVWLKQYMKLYKAMFHKYATVNSNKQTIKKLTFDDMKEQKNTMSLAEVFAFLNDFKLSQRYSIKRDNIKKIISLINLKNDTSSKHFSDLDMFGFIEFVLQLGHFINDDKENPSVFLPLLFRYLKETSLASDKPLFQRLFENPQASSIGDPELIRQLTEYVNQDPNYKLPPGFIKYQKKVPVEKYRVPDKLSESEKIARLILNEIFFDTFGMHQFDPQVEAEQRWFVKPDIFQLQKKKELVPQWNKVTEKHKYNPDPELSQFEFQEKMQKYGILAPNRAQKHLKSQTRVKTKALDEIQENPITQQSIRQRNQSTVRLQPLQSSIEEQGLDMTLKIQVAQNIMNPLRVEIKEAAFLMEDMLRTLEKGQVEFSPKTKHKIYSIRDPLAEKGKPLNKVLATKLEQQMQEEQENREAKLQLKARQAKLKEKMKAYTVESQKKKQEDKEKYRAESEQRQLKEQAKQNEKKQYYQSLKKEYEDVRLPEVMKKEQEAKQKKMQDKEVKAQRKANAEQKVQETIEKLRISFEQKIAERKEADLKKKADEEKQKRILQAKTDALAGNRNSKLGTQTISNTAPPPAPVVEQKQAASVQQKPAEPPKPAEAPKKKGFSLF